MGLSAVTRAAAARQPAAAAAAEPGQPAQPAEGPQSLADWIRTAAEEDQAYQALLEEAASEGRTLSAPPQEDSTEGELQACDGLLYRGSRLVIPNDQSLRLHLLVECHDSASAGHPGVSATYDKLRSHVYWAGLKGEVEAYVTSCDSCQRNKPEQRRTAGLLRPPPIPDEPGYALNMDFVTGLPQSRQGHTAYLSITCRLSGLLQVGLCSDTVTAEQAAQLVFKQWVVHYGLPAVIISDRDPRFTGLFWRALWKQLDTRLDMSTAGHPQTDGKAENKQRTANTMVRHYVDWSQKDWDEQLLRAVFAINHTRSRTTGLTPFQVMFGRSPRIPLDSALAPLRSHEPAEGRVPAADRVIGQYADLWKETAEQQRKAQLDQKRFADRHRREEIYAVGDLVLLSVRDLRLADDREAKRAGKFSAKWVGPFPVSRVINDNAYELELPPQLAAIHAVQNVSKLRRYKQSPDRFAGRPEPNNRPPPVATDPAGTGEWEVERILAARSRGRGGRNKEYLVKWKGYSNEDCQWLAKRDLNCPDLLQEFEDMQ